MQKFEILASVKKTLRIEQTDIEFDEELDELICEAIEDLKTSSVSDKYESLCVGAIKAYVRAHFEIDADTSDKILKVYESKKQKLSILGGD